MTQKKVEEKQVVGWNDCVQRATNINKFYRVEIGKSLDGVQVAYKKQSGS